jgi:hypothetical protein
MRSLSAMTKYPASQPPGRLWWLPAMLSRSQVQRHGFASAIIGAVGKWAGGPALRSGRWAQFWAHSLPSVAVHR